MITSTVTALVAAAFFAVTTNLQRAAASSVPAAGPAHLVRRLLADPRWLAGGLIGAAALILHGAALAGGSVVVVQSVMAVGLVIALGVEAWRERRPLRAHELGGATLVVMGVAAIVSVSRVPAPDAESGRPAAVVCGLVALVVLAGVLGSRRHVGSRWGARLLAAGAGACFAVDAVFLQRLASLLESGGSAVAGSWPQALAAVGDLAGFCGTSAVGTVAVHRAYQVAPLRAVQPALAAAEPVTAFVVGMTVLHEGVRVGAAGYAFLTAGIAIVVTGIFLGLAGRSGPQRAPIAAGRRDVAGARSGRTGRALDPLLAQEPPDLVPAGSAVCRRAAWLEE